MPLVRPFAALRPARAHAAEVAAPPYDVLSSDEARVRAAGKPWSFLHVSKPEIDLAPGADPYSPTVYAKGAENLARMREAGVLVRDPAPAYYVYRFTVGDLVQTGVAVAASIAAYDANRVRKHELTRPDKEDDRVRHMEALNAQTGPVLAAYPAAPQLDALLAEIARGEPETDVVADGGVRHSIWPVRDAARDRAHRRAVRCDAGDLHRRRPPPLRRRLARAPRTGAGPGRTAATSGSSSSPFRITSCGSSTTTASCAISAASPATSFSRSCGQSSR